MEFKEVVLDGNDALKAVRQRGLHELFLHLAKTSGDRVLLRSGANLLYLCARPADVKSIFASGHRNHRKPLNDIMGDGLFSVSSSPQHKETRQAIQPVYSNSKIREISHLIAAPLRRYLAEQFVRGEAVDSESLFEAAKKSCVYINTIAMFGLDVPPAIVAAVSEMHRGMTDGFFNGVGVEGILADPTFSGAKQAIHDHIATVVARHVATEGAYVPLVVELAQTLKDNEVGHADLNGEVLSLLGSGLETAGASIFWALYELARHPQEQERLHGWITTSDVAASEFSLRRDTPVAEVILETLRLYPSGWAMYRQMMEQVELEPGIEIPAGARVCVSPYVTHRIERQWAEPERFLPSRFADSAEVAQAYAQYRFFPFAGGHHRCIGERLALMSIGMVLSEFVCQYRIALCAPGELATQNKLCLEPLGRVEFKLTTRAQ
ncbi:cytochrome P450 [Chitinimonas lacunae]|uniref:Cytochrome P450 n=1 Tax=Chitinimonas lacunae TaxID=1963018 RepID=A0ABV8MLY0_9NEIS